MTREMKYPDTKYFKYHNENYKNRIGGDCVIRAISLSTGKGWVQTIRELTEVGIKLGYVCNDDKTFIKYLLENGFEQCKEPRDEFNRKLTAKEFIDSIDFKYKTIVAMVGSHHLVCIKDNKVYDIWDCSKNTMHRYWVLK